jgi:nitrous oxidase accessory protein NosD
MSRVTLRIAFAIALALGTVATAATAATDGTAVAAARYNVGPGESLQAAVDAAEPGDTIRVTGRHYENVVIQTNGLTLLGYGAVILPPATPTAHACHDPTVIDEAVHGICVWGDIDVDSGEIARYVEDVTVLGFRIRGFAGTGLVAVAAKRATFAGNTIRDNIDSGINTSNSLGTRIWGNRSTGNEFGLFSSLAEGTSIVGNTIRGNCAGVALLAAADTLIGANQIARNSRSCPAVDDFPALSGVGVALVSSTGSTVVANGIVHNRATGESAFVGGVVVAQDSSGSLVKRNVILRNDPDLSWDETGNGNVFRHNICATSVPSNLCG